MPTISRRLASEGTADPGDLKSPSLPGASPGSPTGVWLIGNSRPVRLKIEQPWECKSPHADQSGMSTGQADRASVLTSACLRASGASPRHSAIQTELMPEGRRMAMLLKEYRICRRIKGCVFCKRKVSTRGHHVVPRCKGGTETAPTCHSREDFIHKTWSHKELRDAFNTVEKSGPIHWLYKQQPSVFFRTRRNRSRTSQPYR